jgi:hypothetical protein
MALILWPVSDTTALPRVLLHALAAAAAYLAIFCTLDIGATRQPAGRALRLGADLLRASHARLVPNRRHLMWWCLVGIFGVGLAALAALWCGEGSGGHGVAGQALVRW